MACMGSIIIGEVAQKCFVSSSIVASKLVERVTALNLARSQLKLITVNNFKPGNNCLNSILKMDRKCWFVLPYTHYPPPILAANGTGHSKGPICCGHVIPDLEHLDSVINRQGPEEIPPDMPLYHTQSRNLAWKQTSDIGTNNSFQFDTPGAAAIGLTAKASAGIAFNKSVSSYAKFGILDTFVMQVTHSYIEDTLCTEEVAKHIHTVKRLGSWSVFMITGVIVARGAELSKSKERNIGLTFGIGRFVNLPSPVIEKEDTQVPILYIESPSEFTVRWLTISSGIDGVAGADANSEISTGNGTSMAGESVTDFVWAVRLAKISKGLLDRDWCFETFSKGATYSLEEPRLYGQIVEKLQREGIREDHIVTNDQDNEVYII